MDIKYYPNATDFLANTSKYLARDEARYGLIFGIARRLVENPHWYGQVAPWFCAEGTGQDLCAVAMRTPPFKVLLGHFSGDPAVIAAPLVTAISKKEPVIPGVTGDKELADRFMELWTQKHGVAIQKTIMQRIYRLLQVNSVPLSRGRLRPATMADKELVIKWSHAFHIDTYGDVRNMPETDITPALSKGAVFLWEELRPVSMAVKSRPTEKGMTVGGVYTPPELRRKGYATSCVAELCRDILRSGYQFCTLYTDLANPTSNSIYKKIGFVEVGDSVDYTFEMPEQPGALG